MRIRYRILLIMCLTVLAGISSRFAAYGTEKSTQRVFDEAGLLTVEEIEDLETQIASLQKLMRMDVVLVTTDETNGKDSRNYADDYYDYGGFGVGKNANGVLFLIDMDNREIYISTSGAMIRFLTDKRIDNMLDREIVYMKKSDYFGTMNQFLKDVEGYYRDGIPNRQYNYDIETGMVSRYYSIRWYEILAAIVIPGFVAFSTCCGVAKSYEMKKERKQGTDALLAYRQGAAYDLSIATDELIDKTLTHRRIETHSSGGGTRSGGSRSSGGRSSTHRSSSGRSHGGGGRKF